VYDDGTQLERDAESATFLFFDGEKQTQVPQNVILSWGQETPSDPTVSDQSDAVVVVAGREEPKEVLVILNDPNPVNYFLGKSKTDVLGEITAAQVDKVKGEGTTAVGQFVMTNASYIGDTDVVTATSLIGTDGKSLVKKSRKEAEENPVQIYVERLAAKVTITNTGNFKPSTTDPFQVNGLGKLTLTPVITGVTVANIAAEEYLFKNLDADWTAINSAAAHRANWAVTPDDVALVNDSYENIVVGYTNTPGGIDAASIANPFYVRENTLDNPEDSKISYKTSVLLTAQLTTDGTLDTAIDALVRWAGIYYTPDMFLTQGLNFLSAYSIKSTDAEGKDHYNNLTADDVTLAYYTKEEHEAYKDLGLLQYENALKVTNETVENLYKKEGNNWVEATVEDMNKTLLEKNNRCWYWNEGKSYYFVEISDLNAPKDFQVGVVRNNSYKVNLRTLSGLGVPVYNPGEEIIPQTPEEDLFYVGAQINILKWRVISQEADFTQGGL
ncbi:MAG: Mfa1 family fimbria major subunit, partial [Muribaculaceae bacterium]|nr:Mfa1 family fimbria major subunit [Muribaculaceae bacterium]